MQFKEIISNKWFQLFIAIFIFHLGAIIFDVPTTIVLTKPFLLIAIFFFYFFTAKKQNNISSKILAALSFSWLGDVLLVFQNQHSVFFIFGLISFLTAHIFYTLFFYTQIKDKKINWLFILPVLVFVVSFCYLLQPKLGSMQLPVFVYATVISIMLLVVLHNSNKKAAYLVLVLGALLFVISDSILAFNKFYAPFSSASFLIMFTYGLAQLLLVTGILNNELATNAVE